LVYDDEYVEALNDKKVWFVTRLNQHALYRLVKRKEVTRKNISADYEILEKGLFTICGINKQVTIPHKAR
jgi:hypothetical protein